MICGIDEAGRSPVIGPLVICGVLVEDESKLKELKVKDSKLLTPKQREHLFERIIKNVRDYRILIIEPSEIDASVDSKIDNLNWLEAKKTAEIINYLMPDAVYVDCPSNNIKAYTNYLKKLLINKNIKIIAEHKADVHYPVVSAASILAKVTRDNEIEKIRKIIKKDIGSGYPSDPVTVKFLKENHNVEEFYQYIRKSWAPYKGLKAQKFQKRLGEF